MKRQIVNIVNFIRAVEPRGPVDLMEPVRELTRIGIPLQSRVDEHADRIEVVITLPLRQA